MQQEPKNTKALFSALVFSHKIHLILFRYEKQPMIESAVCFNTNND